LNWLPPAGPDFPQEWIEEFRRELATNAAARCESFSKVLLAVELALLAFDIFRIRGLGIAIAEALVPWRVSFIIFLGLYAFFAARIQRIELRAKVFLVGGMGFAIWISAGVLPGLSGDLSVFAIGLLTISALCPFPGRFGTLFCIVCAVILGFALSVQHDARFSFWLSNVVAGAILAIVVERTCYRAALTEFGFRKGLQRQRERVDELLYNVFPQTVAASLKDGKRSVASHSEVTILFADVVGFTQLASRLLPSQLVEILETLFSRFDDAARRHGVEKIKTIGDAYMAISGAPVSVERSVERMAEFALDVVRICDEFGKEAGFDLALRVGIHTGPVVAGVIGSSRLCYDLWGDSVNIAQRLEAHGERNLINVSEPVYHRLRGNFRLEDRGMLELKGKGPTRTYALRGIQSAAVG
jgi:class 3 adenylate cyclase